MGFVWPIPKTNVKVWSQFDILWYSLQYLIWFGNKLLWPCYSTTRHSMLTHPTFLVYYAFLLCVMCLVKLIFHYNYNYNHNYKYYNYNFRLEKFSAFFAARSSPTDAILTLWEAIQTNNNSDGTGNILVKDPSSDFRVPSPNPLSELLNLLRVIGREDAALMIEKDFSPWF